MSVNAEEIYYKLREVAEEFGFVPEDADEHLGDAAESIANFSENSLVNDGGVSH